jgi:hypothetical protein
MEEEELAALCAVAHLEAPEAVRRIVVGLADLR